MARDNAMTCPRHSPTGSHDTFRIPIYGWGRSATLQLSAAHRTSPGISSPSSTLLAAVRRNSRYVSVPASPAEWAPTRSAAPRLRAACQRASACQFRSLGQAPGGCDETPISSLHRKRERQLLACAPSVGGDRQMVGLRRRASGAASVSTAGTEGHE